MSGEAPQTNSAQDESPRSILRSPIFWGALLSIALVGTYIALASLERCIITDETEICASNFARFVSSAPNEIGDTLAGLAGGLAFLWIIVTVMLQSQELREQRKELRQARIEYAKMSAAQEEQVKILQAQGDIFQDEQRQRLEERNKDYFEQSLASLKSTLEDMAPHFRVLLLPVQFNKARGSSSIDELRMYCDEVDIIFLRKEVGSIDEFFLSLSRHLTSNAGYIDQLLKDRVWLRGPPERGLKMLLDEFSRVERLVENLSKDQKLRFIGMRHSSIVDELSVLGKLPIWAPDQEYEDGEVSSKGVAASLGNLASSAP